MHQAQKKFPNWLITYLDQCAERMLSDKAKKEGRDLRQVLPWVFGFPNSFDPKQRKRGPGNLLDPGPNPAKMIFALRFAIRLEEGENPAAARRNACNDVFDEKMADADDKTLQRWLLEEFDLKKQPSSAEEWKIAAHEHYKSIWRSLHEWASTHQIKSRETLT